MYRYVSTPLIECSVNGMMDRSVILSISEPGILQNFVNVELIVAVDAKKFGKARFAKQAVCFLPINAYGARF